MDATRRRILLGAFLACSFQLLPGCRSEPLSATVDGGDGDAALGGDLGLAEFCNDERFPRLEVNGLTAVAPSVAAREQFLDCCEAAAFEIISMQIPGEVVPLVFSWRGFPGGTPSKVDLASPPKGWSATLTSSCSIDATGCIPNDAWVTGTGANDIRGTMTITRRPNGGGFVMSVCAAVSESDAKPHPVLHDVRLWVPPTPTRSE
jgi:hypothetical protein